MEQLDSNKVYTERELEALVAKLVSVNYIGTATAPNNGIAISSACSESISGINGVSISTNNSKSISGHGGTSITENNSVSISGDYGTAKSIVNGKSISGKGGRSNTGIYGAAQAGEGGILSIDYFEGGRVRVKIGYIGEDGLLPDVPYILRDGKFTIVTG